MWLLISGFVVLPLILFLLIVVLYRAAKYKQQATFVKEGTIEFIMSGEDLTRVLVNADGYIINDDGYIKPESSKYAVPKEEIATEEEIRSFNRRGNFLSRYLRNNWGFYWVSIFYPIKRVHEFEITKARLRPANKTSGDAPLSERIEMDDKAAKTDHLRVRFPRPFLFERAETSDNFQTDLLVVALFRVVRPHTVVFMVGKEFFTTLEGAISGTVLDFMKSMRYGDFLTTPTGKGSGFSEVIRKLNYEPSPSYPNGIIADLGVMIIDAWVEDYGLAGNSLRVVEATQALEVQTLEGQADLKRADYDMQAAQKRAIGTAAEIVELGKAYAALPPSAASAIVNQVVSRNLAGRDSKIHTLALGGGTGLTLLTNPNANQSTPDSANNTPAPAAAQGST